MPKNTGFVVFTIFHRRFITCLLSAAWHYTLPRCWAAALGVSGGIDGVTLQKAYNAGYLSIPIKTLFCPSDDASLNGALMTNRADLGNNKIGLTNYKGVSGANWAWTFGVAGTGRTNGDKNGLADEDGAFFRGDGNKRVRLTDITDGLSNTLMIGEDIPAFNQWCSWPYSNHAVGACAIPPNYQMPPGMTASPGNWPTTYSFRSRHTNGLQFAYTDGSVHFINQGIDIALYRAMATIQGGEAVQVP